MRRRSSSVKLRRLAFERDKGICAQCAADCEKVKRVYWAILDFDAQCFYGDVLRSNGQVFWEADHVLEVANNGSDSLRNIQTLCVACHRVKSAAFRPPDMVEPILYCAVDGCDDPSHLGQLLETLRDEYDARYYVGDGDRFTVNLGVGLKPDYMVRAYGPVKAHYRALRQLLITDYEQVEMAQRVC